VAESLALMQAFYELDMDVATTRHCNSIGIVEPNDVDDRMKMHLRILYQHINQRSATS